MDHSRAANKGDGTPRDGNKKIIIVDDDRDTRELLQFTLEGQGYDVKLAANGLRLISTLHVDKPDLILLDVMMSWIDGFELCHAIKQNSEFRDIPVVFISGRTSQQDIDRGYQVGCVDYFTKPLDLARLLSRVKEVTNSGDAGSDPSN